MALTKPPVFAPWGNTNTTTADMLDPGGLQNTGFLPWPVVPVRENMNFLLNRLENAIRYACAQGLPAWDASEAQYVVGSFVQFGGLGYRLKVASPAGTDPATDIAHWELMVPVPPGTRLSRRIITASGSYAVTAGTKRATIRGVGAAGGAAGARGPDYYAAGGGAAGSFGEFDTVTIPGANWVVVIGAAGSSGVAPGSFSIFTAGAAGGTTTLSDGTNTFTFPPGGGGDSSGLGGTPGAAPSVAPGTGVTTIFARPGEAGTDGLVGVAPDSTVQSGKGGSSPFGEGGAARSTATGGATGRDGSGYGAAGSGGISTGLGAAGGVSKPAAIELIEFS